MKPNFALNLSHDGIALYHRGVSGWTTVGTVALDDADVSAALEVMRKTAVSLEAGGMTTKVLIPDSQILFTDLDVPAAPRADRVQMIRARLDGITPYAVEDLVFDWRPLGADRVRLAVVARETLAEAEAFASEHRFNPVSFAASPAADVFDGEPFFGPAAAAKALLAETGPLEPDREAMVLTTSRAAPDLGDTAATGDPGPAPQAAAPDPLAAPPAPAPDQTAPGPAAPSKAAPLAEPTGSAVAAEAPDTLPAASEPDDLAEAPFADLSADTDDAAAEAPGAPRKPDDPKKEATGPEDGARRGPVSATGSEPSPGGGGRVLALHGEAGASEDDSAEAPVLDAVAEAGSTPGPAFASRRALRAAARGGNRGSAATSASAPPDRGDQRERIATRIPRDDRQPPRLVAGSALERIEPVVSARPGLVPRDEAPPIAGRGGATPDPDAPAVGTDAQVRRLPPLPPRTPPTLAAPQRRAPVINFGPKLAARDAAAAPSVALTREGHPVPRPAPDAEGDLALSVFGAQKAPGRRSPMIVVLLTLALLVGLAALALWSTFWADDAPLTDRAVGLDTGVVRPDGAASVDAPGIGPTPGSQGSPLPGNAGPAPDATLAEEPDATLAEEPDATLAEEPDVTPPPDPLPAPVAILPSPGPGADPALPEDPEAAAALAAVPDAPDAGNGTAADLAALPDDEAAGNALEDAGTDLPVAPGAEVAALPDVADTPSVEDEALADGEPDAVLVPDAGDGPDAAAPEIPAPDTPALPADPVTELVGTDDGAAERVAAQLLEELTPEVAEKRYASTGVWVLPPESPAEPGVDSVDDLYVAAIDPQIEGEDAVALPAPAPDGSILSPLPPPAAGTTFDFDARGLVRPTPEGALNPDGILIHLGKPPVTPKPRPGSVVPDVAAPAPESAIPAPDARPAPDDSGLPRVPGVPNTRPKPRPDDLTQLNEKATLGGRTRVELATIRPRQRPAVIAALVEAAATPDAPAEAQVALELAPATRFAVPVSRLPKARPGNIAALVAAAQVAPRVPAIAAPAVKGKTGADAAVPEDDGEPVLAAAAVMPKLPTKATVAKSATVANALNLSKVNLIGVYGSPSSRRALVRLSNGKFVKVKIGDKIDGGKVAAIGEAELVYVKSGRQVRLAMPTKS
jgi:hypothetical protein